MLTHLRSILLTLLFNLVYFVAMSQTPIVDPNNRQTQIRAVIIGVAKYADSLNFENLKFADKDAEAYAKFLTSDAGGKVPPQNIRLLRNEEATRKSIIDALDDIYGAAQSEDILIFYFSGHGESTGSGATGILCPFDIQKKSINATAFKMNDLDGMFQSRAKIKMTLIDACHAGLIKKDNPNSLDRVKSAFQVQKISEINSSIQKYLNSAPEGNVSILSCQGMQESAEIERLGHGAFTYYLLRGLQGEADKFIKVGNDYGDGRITIRELYGYIHEGVAHETNNLQIPLLNKTLPDDMVISTCEPDSTRPKPLRLEELGDFNRVDPDTTHRYASRWIDFEKPAIDFECPTDTASGILVLQFTFTNPTIAKDVAFIYIEINQYRSKIGQGTYTPVYYQAYKPQAGLNRFVIENHMNRKNVELQIGYALKKKPTEDSYHYYHVSCYSPNSVR